jgi:hypothetical protein
MAYPLPFKDPDEVLDYDLSWAKRLAGDEILTSIAEVVDPGPDSVTIESQDFLGTVQKLWLSGGAEGTTSAILVRITTRDGRTMDQTVKIKVKTK